MPGRKGCTVCGAAMHRFLNPERWVCPRQDTHAAILAARQERGRQTASARAKKRRLLRWLAKNQQPRDPKTGKFIKGAKQKPKRKKNGK